MKIVDTEDVPCRRITTEFGVPYLRIGVRWHSGLSYSPCNGVESVELEMAYEEHLRERRERAIHATGKLSECEVLKSERYWYAEGDAE